MVSCSTEASLGVSELKRLLADEVRALFRRNGSLWKEPILDVLQDLRQSNVQAVLFGGTLRSLLVSRIFSGRPGRPRDVDVVVAGAPLARLEEQFSRIITRRTRFGGLQLRRGQWQFDVWPVGETWAFKQDRSETAGFAELPSTTTFNLEAIAVEAWASDGRSRAMFSGNDQFFQGILTRTIELNRIDNPYPELTVVRALVMASELRFRVGPRLARYVADTGSSLSPDLVERLQTSHYGQTKIPSDRLIRLIEHVSARSDDQGGCELPFLGQLGLWEGAGEPVHPTLKVHCLSA